MENKKINILLVEDNPSDARLFQERLKEVSSEAQFGLTHVEKLRDALKTLEKSSFDVILLDLGLPDSMGLDGFTHINKQISSIPIIVITGTYEDEKLAVQAVKEGAQDYLFKDQLDGNLLVRSIRYAIERKRTEVELIEARERAEASDRLKSVFLGTMSHELRTPLTTILGYTDLLSQLGSRIAEEKQKKFLETIRRNSLRLKNLIDDILDISHIEADKTVLNMEIISPDELVNKAVSDILLSARDKKLEIQENYLSSDGKIKVDKTRFQQVVLNILQNAVKYTDKGSITINTNVSNGEYLVSISDKGIGIKDEFKPFLFAQFRQGDEGPSRKYEGAGLGLAITHRLVVSMGGRIEVESEEGKGSTFTIYFPLEKEDKAGSLTQNETIKFKDLNSSIYFNQKKVQAGNVLVLQDNPDNLNYIENIIGMLGLITLSAETGEKALELLQNSSVCCMLVDIALKRGVTGIDFMKQIKKMNQFKKISIIAVTAYAMKDQKEELLREGFDDYLAKPFTIEDLKEILSRHLSN